MQAVASKKLPQANKHSGSASHSPDYRPKLKPGSTPDLDQSQQLSAGPVPVTPAVSAHSHRSASQAPAATAVQRLQLPHHSLSTIATASELTSRATSAPSLQHLSPAEKRAIFETSQRQPRGSTSGHESNGGAVTNKPGPNVNYTQTEQARLVQFAAQAKLHQHLHQHSQTPIKANADSMQAQVSYTSAQHAVPSWCSMNASEHPSAQRSLRQYIASGSYQNTVPTTSSYGIMQSNICKGDTQQTHGISALTHAQHLQMLTHNLQQQAHQRYTGTDMGSAHLGSLQSNAKGHRSDLLMQAARQGAMSATQGQMQWTNPAQHPMQQGMSGIIAMQPELATGWHNTAWQQPAVQTLHSSMHMPGQSLCLDQCSDMSSQGALCHRSAHLADARHAGAGLAAEPF